MLDNKSIQMIFTEMRKVTGKTVKILFAWQKMVLSNEKSQVLFFPSLKIDCKNGTAYMEHLHLSQMEMFPKFVFHRFARISLSSFFFKCSIDHSLNQYK